MRFPDTSISYIDKGNAATVLASKFTQAYTVLTRRLSSGLITLPDDVLPPVATLLYQKSSSVGGVAGVGSVTAPSKVANRLAIEAPPDQLVRPPVATNRPDQRQKIQRATKRNQPEPRSPRA